MPKIKVKERLLNREREKQFVNRKEASIDFQLLSQQNTAYQKGVARSIQGNEKQESKSKMVLSRNTIIQNRR